MISVVGDVGTGSTSLQLFTGVTYTQNGVYAGCSAATEAGMTNGNASGLPLNQTGLTSANPSFVKADLGGSKYVSHVVIGMDYLNNVPGGWGTSYIPSSAQGSTDDTNWTTIISVPSYASSGSKNGLVTLLVNATYNYIRMHKTSYFAITEFQVWGY
jgi:hypothetical protein